VTGCVTALIEESTHTICGPITKSSARKVPSRPSAEARALDRGLLLLCAGDRAQERVAEAVAKKTRTGANDCSCASRRRPATCRSSPTPEEVWNIIEEWREAAVQTFARTLAATAETIRKLEDKVLVTIAPQIASAIPTPTSTFCPTTPLT
jgi:hypothetical protein